MSAQRGKRRRSSPGGSSLASSPCLRLPHEAIRQAVNALVSRPQDRVLAHLDEPTAARARLGACLAARCAALLVASGEAAGRPPVVLLAITICLSARGAAR